jgi:hypothetical protein
MKAVDAAVHPHPPNADQKYQFSNSKENPILPTLKNNQFYQQQEKPNPTNKLYGP